MWIYPSQLGCATHTQSMRLEQTRPTSRAKSSSHPTPALPCRRRVSVSPPAASPTQDPSALSAMTHAHHSGSAACEHALASEPPPISSRSRPDLVGKIQREAALREPLYAISNAISNRSQIISTRSQIISTRSQIISTPVFLRLFWSYMLVTLAFVLSGGALLRRRGRGRRASAAGGQAYSQEISTTRHRAPRRSWRPCR